LAGSLLLLISFVFSFFGMPYFFTAFIYFGYPFSYAIANCVPSSFVYWLVPGGGTPAAVGVFILGTWSQLVILSALVSYFFILKKEKARTSGSKRA
jgi:hypothetical protein